MLAKNSGLEKAREAGNICGSGDGGSGSEEDDEECKYGKGDDDEAAVDSFLGNIVKGYSHRDPEKHQNNISHLNEEIILRSKLETELSNTRKELTEAQKREVETRSFLDRLPKHLGDVDKASLPLHNFLKGSSRRRVKAETTTTTDGLVATAPSAQLLILTKWSERISAALNFPVPLYTLFLQLHSYLDALSALVEEFSGFLVDFESSDEGSDGGGAGDSHQVTPPKLGCNSHENSSSVNSSIILPIVIWCT